MFNVRNFTNCKISHPIFTISSHFSTVQVKNWLYARNPFLPFSPIYGHKWERQTSINAISPNTPFRGFGKWQRKVATRNGSAQTQVKILHHGQQVKIRTLKTTSKKLQIPLGRNGQ